jgi:TP901 family phage tail tape measure protein
MPSSLKLPVTQTGLEQSIQQALKTAGKNSQINLGTNSRQINALAQPLGRITGQADEFTKSMEAANARVFAFGASVGVINSVSKAFSALVKNTIATEKALTDININLGQSSKELDKFGNDLFNLAKNTGQSFETVAQGALELSRQGLNAVDVVKRLNDALILSRLSGLDAQQSVEGLTAAINSFADAGITSEQIVNKLVVVSQKYAVSERDLIEGIKRSASVADQAGVSFDELVGIITTVQERTARGGAVIGNAFKTIFAKIQDKGALEDLQNLGIKVTDAAGKILPATSILQNLSKEFEGLSQIQQTDIAKKLGGVYQLSNLLAAVKDLGSEQSKYAKIVELSQNASSEAYKKNAALNETLAAIINKVSISAEQLSVTLGNLGITDNLKNLLNFFGGLLDSFQKILGEESAMGGFIRGLAKGLGNLITGPGLALFGAIILKLSKDLVQFGFSSLKSFFGISKAAKDIASVEQAINSALATNIGLQQKLFALEGNRSAQLKVITDALIQQEAVIRRSASISKDLSTPSYQLGVRATSQGLRVPPSAASGYMPAMQKEASDINKGVGGARSGDRPVVIPNFNFGGGKKGSIVAHTGEYAIPNFAGSGGTAIFNRNMVQKMGLPAGAKKINAAGGLVPNFAMTDLFPAKFGLAGSTVKKEWNQFRATYPNAPLNAFSSSPEVINAYKDWRSSESRSISKTESKELSSLSKLSNTKRNAEFGFIYAGNQPVNENKQVDVEGSSVPVKFLSVVAEPADYLYKEVRKNAIQTAKAYAKNIGIQPDVVDENKFESILNQSLNEGSLQSMVGTIFEAALQGSIGSVSGKSNANFDIPNQAQMNSLSNSFGKLDPNHKNYGLSSALRGLRAGDFKNSLNRDNISSFQGKIARDAINKGTLKTASSGYIPNFANYVYDSDQLTPEQRKTFMMQIMKSPAKKNALLAPAGAGKTTIASKIGPFIKSAADIAKATEFTILSAAARAKDGGLSKPFQEIVSSVAKSGGKMSYLHVPSLEIKNRRSARSIGEGDLRSQAQLKGTRYAPFNQYDFLAKIKKELGPNFEIINGSKGYMPNFSDPLKDAVNREMTAGVPSSQIYIDKNPSLKSASNPMGLMVANRRDEPMGGQQGISRAIKEGRNPKTYGAAGGFVPNYAAGVDLAPFAGKSVPQANAQIAQELTDSLNKIKAEYINQLKELAKSKKTLEKKNAIEQQQLVLAQKQLDEANKYFKEATKKGSKESVANRAILRDRQQEKQQEFDTLTSQQALTQKEINNTPAEFAKKQKEKAKQEAKANQDAADQRAAVQANAKRGISNPLTPRVVDPKAEKVSKDMLGTIFALQGAMSLLTGFTADATSGIGKFANSVAEGASTFATMQFGFQGLSQAFPKFAGFLGPAGLAISGLTAAYQIGISTWNQYNGVTAAVTASMEAVGKAADGAAINLANVGAERKAAIKQQAQQIGNNLKYGGAKTTTLYSAEEAGTGPNIVENEALASFEAEIGGTLNKVLREQYFSVIENAIAQQVPESFINEQISKIKENGIITAKEIISFSNTITDEMKKSSEGVSIFLSSIRSLSEDAKSKIADMSTADFAELLDTSLIQDPAKLAKAAGYDDASKYKDSDFKFKGPKLLERLSTTTGINLQDLQNQFKGQTDEQISDVFKKIKTELEQSGKNKKQENAIKSQDISTELKQTIQNIKVEAAIRKQINAQTDKSNNEQITSQQRIAAIKSDITLSELERNRLLDNEQLSSDKQLASLELQSKELQAIVSATKQLENFQGLNMETRAADQRLIQDAITNISKNPTLSETTKLTPEYLMESGLSESLSVNEDLGKAILIAALNIADARKKEREESDKILVLKERQLKISQTEAKLNDNNNRLLERTKNSIGAIADARSMQANQLGNQNQIVEAQKQLKLAELEKSGAGLSSSEFFSAQQKINDDSFKRQLQNETKQQNLEAEADYIRNAVINANIDALKNNNLALKENTDAILKPKIQQNEEQKPTSFAGNIIANIAKSIIGGGSSFDRIIDKNATGEKRNIALTKSGEGIKLLNILQRAAEDTGVNVEIISALQNKQGEGSRTGSTRHDHDIGAADIKLKDPKTKDYYDFTTTEGQDKFSNFIKKSISYGATGVGAGVDYMGSETAHIGFGSKAIWSSEKSGQAIEPWLQEAASGYKMQSNDQMKSTGIAAVDLKKTNIDRTTAEMGKARMLARYEDPSAILDDARIFAATLGLTAEEAEKSAVSMQNLALRIQKIGEDQALKEKINDINKLTAATQAIQESTGYKENTSLTKQLKDLKESPSTFSQGMQNAFLEMKIRQEEFSYQFGKEIPRMFSDGLSGAIMSAVDGTSSLKDALKNSAYEFIKAINQKNISNLADKFTTLFVPPNSEGGGAGAGYSAISGLAKTIPSLFASGGQIIGGSGNKDDIPAMLMGGEFVINKKAAQKYGPDFLNALNSGSIGGYAKGGPVQKGPQGNFFTPGQYGLGGISGSQNLLDFASQSSTGGSRDKVINRGRFASLNLEAESARLTNFGRRTGPAAEALRSAKEEAFSLYLQEYKAKQELKKQQKEQSKAFKNQLMMAGLTLAGGAVAQAGITGFNNAFDASSKQGFGKYLEGFGGIYSGGDIGGGKMAGGLKNLFSGNFGLANESILKAKIISEQNNISVGDMGQTSGIGPFDKNGNYIEEWADDPSKWKQQAYSNNYSSIPQDGDPSSVLPLVGSSSNDQSFLKNLFRDDPSRVSALRATGGRIPPASGIDTVSTMLSGGEFVMNRAAAQNIGTGNLQALNAGAKSLPTDEKTEQLNDRLLSKLDELIDASGSAGNITINVENSGKSSQSSEGTNPEAKQQLARQIRDAVLKVIQEEKRLGGQLRRGM